MPLVDNNTPYSVQYLNELISLGEVDNLYAINFKGEIIWHCQSRDNIY